MIKETSLESSNLYLKIIKFSIFIEAKFLAVLWIIINSSKSVAMMKMG